VKCRERHRLPLALLVALALLLAAPHGIATASAYTAEQLARWNSVADQVWPGHCAGQRTTVVVANIPLLPTDGATAAVVNGRADGRADGSCAFRLRDGLPAYSACLVVVHEAGHLEGADHRAATIMDAHVTEVLVDGAYRPCAAVVPPVLTRSAALNWVEARYQRSLWSLDCRRDQLTTRMRCWGSTVRGRRLRWVVWVDSAYAIHGGRLA